MSAIAAHSDGSSRGTTAQNKARVNSISGVRIRIQRRDDGSIAIRIIPASVRLTTTAAGRTAQALLPPITDSPVIAIASSGGA
jgi:hypothetical protein